MPIASFRFIGPMIVRSPNWLGDAIMALPAVRNMKAALWRDKLVVATPEKLAPLWRACPFVDEVLPLPKPRNLFLTYRQIAERKCASAILLPNSIRTAAEVYFANVPQRAGYANLGRRFFLTDAIPQPSFNPHRFHHSNYFLDLVSSLGGPGETDFPELNCKSTIEKASDVAKVVLCPGAEYGPAKRWPIEYFAKVGTQLQRDYGFTIQILGAGGDIPVANELETSLKAANSDGKVENLAGTTNLEQFMGHLTQAKIVICNDSGAMHLASALGIPTVAVFGSTEPRWTGPMGPNSTVLRHHVPCSPCFLRQCPLDLRCFHSITPEQVIQAVTDLLKRVPVKGVGFVSQSKP